MHPHQDSSSTTPCLGPRTILYYDPTTYTSGVGGSFVSLFHLTTFLEQSAYRPLVIFSRENSYIPVFRDASVETLVFDRYARTSWMNRLFSTSQLSFPARVARKVVHLSGLRRLERLLGKEWPAYVRMRALIRERKIALVHANAVLNDVLPALCAAQAEGIPFMCHFRKFATIDSSVRLWSTRVDCGVAISHAVREDLERQRFAAKRLVTVYNGLDPHFIMTEARRGTDEIRREFGWDRSHFVVGMFGSISEWKGQEVFLRAVARVRETMPELRVLLVGGVADPDRTYFERLKDLASAETLDPITLFAGYRLDAYSLMGTCDVVAHASILPEPFGRVIAEAQVAGACVIASNAGGVPEIIRHGQTGFLYPPGNDEALAHLIQWIYEHPEEAKLIAKQGAKESAENFDARRKALEIQAIYEELLS